MQKHVLAKAEYTPPQIETLHLLFSSGQLLEASLTGETYDDELVYEGF